MPSIFAIDITNKIELVKEANFIRLGILMDRLEGDEKVLTSAEKLLLVIYDGNIGKIKACAQDFLGLLDVNYGPTKTREALERLANI